MAISLEFDEETEMRLDRLVRETGRSKEYFIRTLIARSIEDVEDYYLATAVLDRIRSGEEETITFEELERKLDLEN